MPAATLEEYLASLSPAAVAAVNEVRAAIADVLDNPFETISYGVPTFRVDGRNVVHVGGYGTFVSVYPVPTHDEVLLAEITPHRTGKGTLRFPLSESLPLDVIRRVAAALAEARRKQ